MSLIVNDRITIPESELEEQFIRSSGPGGQNVNKVSSAVQLRFNVLTSLNLTDWARERLLRGGQLTKEGVLVIHAHRFRDQQRNRDDARERLFDLIRRAAVVPKKRKPTKPSRASKEKRLQEKKVHSRLKTLRGKRIED